MTMLIQEHIQTAQDFLDAADSEFAGGDRLQGSEKMWGAAAHAVMAVAQQRSWRFGDHSALRTAVRRLSSERDDLVLLGGFGVAEGFHTNFYHDFMGSNDDFDLSRQVVRDFIDRLIALMDVDSTD